MHISSKRIVGINFVKNNIINLSVTVFYAGSLFFSFYKLNIIFSQYDAIGTRKVAALKFW